MSSLINLLACTASGLGFTRFAVLVALPWPAAVGVEYVVVRRFFATDLVAGAQAPPAPEPREVPVFALVTVACTLAGFVVTSAFGANPAGAAAAGAAVLSGRALARRRATRTAIVRAAVVPLCAFVLAVGIVVLAVVDNGLVGGLGHLVPGGTGLPALLCIAAPAAVRANVIVNLPVPVLQDQHVARPVGLTAGGHAVRPGAHAVRTRSVP